MTKGEYKEEIKLDKSHRSSVCNLCPWPVSFTLPISGANVFIEGNKKTSINNEELIVLIENSNVMFAGTGNGNHAKVYVENEELRKYVGYDSEDGKTKQFILSDEECQRILDYKTLSTFEKHLKNSVIFNHEKDKMVKYARKIKLNDYDKVAVIEKHCGLKFKEE